VRLLDWQKDNKISNRELAKRANLHESFLCKYHKGLRRASFVTATRLSEATGGEVSLSDLLIPEETA